MRKLTVSALCIIILPTLASADVVGDVSMLLAEGRYGEALALGGRVAGSQEQIPSVKASVLLLMAQFLENEAGALDRAITAYEHLLELPLAQSDPAVRTAINARDRLKDKKERFAEVYGTLERIGSRSAAEEEAQSAIVTLRALVEKNPDFPELETVHYYLGLYLFLDGQYKRSYNELNRAFALRSVPQVKLPNLERLREQVRKKWLQTFWHNTAWGMIGVFLVVTAILFYSTRPWRWVGLRHWLIVLGLVVAWYGVFTTASKRIGAHAQEEAAVAPGSITSQFSTFGNPAEEAFRALFRYGLMGTFGIAAFAVATARIRLRRTVVVLNGIAGFLLCASLMIVFYERYGTRGRTYLSIEEPRLLDRLKTVILYTTDEIEPFLLTNPTAFPNFDIMTIRDPATRDWFVPYLIRMTEERQGIEIDGLDIRETK